MTLQEQLDLAALVVATLNIIATIAIAIAIARAGAKSEKVENARAVFDQWQKKKDLSIYIPALAKADGRIYNLSGRAESVSKQQEVIWFTIIIDVLFNSFIAVKNGAYLDEVFKEDIRAHFGAIAKDNPKLIRELLVTRGYAGGGVVGEFNVMLTTELDRLEAERAAATAAKRPPRAPARARRRRKPV